MIGDFRQDNITFPDSRISSVVLGGSTGWTHPQHVLELEALTEFATGMFDSDHTFNRFYVDAEWAMPALRNCCHANN